MNGESRSQTTSIHGQHTGLNNPTWELVILVSKSPVGYPIELVVTMDTNYCALFTMVISTDHQLYI